MTDELRRAELCAMTYDSGGYAFDSPEDMIRRAKAAGCTAIAITDMDTVRAFPAAARTARKIGIKVIYGVQLIMADESDVYCVSDWHRVTLLARDEEGLYDLYRLMSRAIERGAYHFTYVTRAEISECRAHLLIGSGGVNGEVFEALEDARDEATCAGIAEFYDYIELYPPCGADNALGAAKVAHINRWVVGLAEKVNKPVVAVGYAEYADCRDAETANAIYYLKNQEMPPIGYDLHLRTTEEMLEAFGSLSPEKAYETVVTNSRKLADMISDNICPFPEEKALPYMEYADGRLESAARRALRELYGKKPPSLLSERLEKELALTRGTPFAATYLIWRHIAQFCRMNGHPTALYGPSVGLRFLSYLLGIHRLNPLPPHYRCPACKHTIFYADTDKFPYEMPPHLCPQCGTEMIADGFSLTEQPRHGVHGSEIYVEMPNVIRKAAIEDLSAYLKENGNLLLHLSCTHQNPLLGRDRRRLAEYEEKRGKPFSEEERSEILGKYRRRERKVQYYQTLFCTMWDEPLYTFGPVTTVNGRTAVGFDFSEWDEASKVYFLTNSDLDRLDAIRSKIGIRTEKMSFDDREVLSALAEDFPNPPEAVPASFREWMELCKRYPQAASFSKDRGRLYQFALQKYRLKWFELHYPEAWASTAAPERRKNG